MTDAGDDGVVDPLVRLRPRLARQYPDRGAAGTLGTARSGRHHLAEPAGDDDRAPLGEKTPDLLGTRFMLRAAADD